MALSLPLGVHCYTAPSATNLPMTIDDAKNNIGKYVFSTIDFTGGIGFVPKGARWNVKLVEGNRVVVIHAPLHGISAGQMSLTMRDLDHFSITQQF